MVGTVIPKVIIHGHIKLQITDGLTAEQALESYKNSYPELAFANLRENGIVNGELQYEVYREQKVGTKG
jgi:hypothetical protein